MNPLRSTVQEILHTDVLVVSFVGTDQYGYVKAYERRATKDVEAPFVVWSLPPGGEPQGHFGDLRSVEERDLQVNSFGRDDDEAWALFHHVEDALERGDWTTLAPYRLISIKRQGDEYALEDPDADLIYVPSTYRVRMSR